eukprot:115338-Pyramimonas_sp.AAC.1
MLATVGGHSNDFTVLPTSSAQARNPLALLDDGVLEPLQERVEGQGEAEACQRAPLEVDIFAPARPTATTDA